MRDTVESVDRQFRTMLLARSGAERIHMGSGMFDSARGMMLASFPQDLPMLEVRQRLLARTYPELVALYSRGASIPVLRLPLAATTYAGAVEWIKGAALAGDRAYAVSAANTHLTTLARHDPGFGRTMEQFDINFPDGMPLVWAMNRQLPHTRQLKDRVYGPTLMLETLKATAGDNRFGHFLLGGKQNTLDILTASLPKKIPGTVISGSYSPPFGEWSPEENKRILDHIRESNANLVWVGLGCPKQENWIAAHKDKLPPAVYIGIGAAFAFHAGEVSQAPLWIQSCGMEWLFRLCAEPRRLFKRYFIYNSLFLWYSLMDSSNDGDGKTMENG